MSMNVQLNYIGIGYANDLANYLSNYGIPTENRVLIVSPESDTVTKTGLIIPGSVKEGIPRKGVVLTRGYIDECNQSYKDITNTGTIITYGLYAGKEMEFDLTEFFNNHLDGDKFRKIIENSKFHVLSLNEIIYAETNLKP